MPNAAVGAAGRTGLDLTWLEVLRPFIPLFAVLILFGALALLLSFFLPSVQAATIAAGALRVANFMVIGLANTNENLQAITDYTPLHFFQGGAAIAAVNWTWFSGLLAVSLLLVLIAWWRFRGRGIRVGGEGGWTFLRAAQR